MPPADRCLVLAAPPEAPGARPTFEASLEGAHAVQVLLTGSGLVWAEDPALTAAAAEARARVAVCTQSARAAGWQPQSSPGWIGWSSVGVWLLRHASSEQLWTVLP